jgi:hypothetical protein
MLAIAAPAALASTTLSGKTLVALIPLFVLLGGLIIVLVSAPLGALAYLVFGKDRHGHDVNEPAGHVAARW